MNGAYAPPWHVGFQQTRTTLGVRKKEQDRKGGATSMWIDYIASFYFSITTSTVMGQMSVTRSSCNHGCQGLWNWSRVKVLGHISLVCARTQCAQKAYCTFCQHLRPGLPQDNSRAPFGVTLLTHQQLVHRWPQKASRTHCWCRRQPLFACCPQQSTEKNFELL